MNNVFNNLTNSLSEEFKKYDLDENTVKPIKNSDMICKLIT